MEPLVGRLSWNLVSIHVSLNDMSCSWRDIWQLNRQAALEKHTLVSRFPQYLRESVNVFHGIVLLGLTYLITAMLTGAKVDAR